MAQISIYTQPITVGHDDIDMQRRVSNLRFVAWMQDVAVAHSAACGWPMERYEAIGQGWVVRQHTITYKRPAFLEPRPIYQRTGVGQLVSISVSVSVTLVRRRLAVQGTWFPKRFCAWDCFTDFFGGWCVCFVAVVKRFWGTCAFESCKYE